MIRSTPLPDNADAVPSVIVHNHKGDHRVVPGDRMIAALRNGWQGTSVSDAGWGIPARLLQPGDLVFSESADPDNIRKLIPIAKVHVLSLPSK